MWEQLIREAHIEERHQLSADLFTVATSWRDVGAIGRSK